MAGYSRAPDGRVVVREGDLFPEMVFMRPLPALCDCQMAEKAGVAMMCFICSGPRARYAFDHTSGDL
jgi:hypothetical protein